MNELEIRGLKELVKEMVNEVLDERELASEESEDYDYSEDEEIASPEEVAEDIPSGTRVDKEKMDEINLKQTKAGKKELEKARTIRKENVQKVRDQDKGFDDEPEVDEETSEDDLSEYEEQN